MTFTDDPDLAYADWCWFHHCPEPITETTYLVCFECKHAFQTERELVDAHNAVVRDINEKHPDWGPPAPEITTGDEAFCCPHCIHDF